MNILMQKDTRMVIMMVGEMYFQQMQRYSPGLVPVISWMSSLNLTIEMFAWVSSSGKEYLHHLWRP